MIKKLFIIGCVLAVIGAAAGGALYYAFPNQVSILGGLTRNYSLSWSAPPGVVTTELNAAYRGAETITCSPAAEASSPSFAAAVAARFTHLFWPTKIVIAKIVVPGLDSASASQ